MTRFLILATAGAGGDLQPLIAVARGLRQRGHDLFFLGDASVANEIQPLGFEGAALPPEHDLGPRLIAAVRESLAQPEAERGEHVKRRMSTWASALAPVVQDAIRRRAPQHLLNSLFGVEVARLATADS